MGLLTVACAGAVVVAQLVDTRDPRFKTCHRENFIHQLHNQITEKMKIKKKRPVMAHLLKTVPCATLAKKIFRSSGSRFIYDCNSRV